MKTSISAFAIAAAAGLASGQVLINEFLPNPSGGDPDTTTVELLGTPGATFSGFLVSIENDGASGVISNSGPDDDIEEVGGIFDSNGLLTVTIGDLENPSFTLILTDAFTGENEDGASPTDIDTNDDGLVDDLSDFGVILDAIGVADSEGDFDVNYASQLGGTSIAFTGDEPGLVFRDGVTLDVYAINDPFDGAVFAADGTALDPSLFDVDVTGPDFNTFGDVNPTIPTPGVAGVVALGGLVAARRRRA